MSPSPSWSPFARVCTALMTEIYIIFFGRAACSRGLVGLVRAGFGFVPPGK